MQLDFLVVAVLAGGAARPRPGGRAVTFPSPAH